MTRPARRQSSRSTSRRWASTVSPAAASPTSASPGTSPASRASRRCTATGGSAARRGATTAWASRRGRAACCTSRPVSSRPPSSSGCGPCSSTSTGTTTRPPRRRWPSGSRSPTGSAELLLERGHVEVLARGVPRVELAQRLQQQLLDRPVAIPLAIGRDDVPRRGVAVAARQRVLVGGGIVVPALALSEVADVELPALRRVLEAGQQPLALLVARDVQHALDPRDAGLGLEALDLRVAALPRREVVDADDQDVLVVRAVEDPELPRLRQRTADAPQEVVLELGGRGLLERGDPQPRRV